jgi:hypothetical protein
LVTKIKTVKTIFMKNKKFMFNYALIGLIILLGCERRKLEDLQPLSYPAKGEVFLDDFTGDLAYAAFGGSDVKAFQVDNQVTYNNTRQSMRFDVPDANSPNGSYAGGVFFSRTGRDLSGFNALTFFIKSSQSATIGELGFGNDLGENKFVVSLGGITVNSNWKKVIIPIPDATKLKGEKGLFYYATGPENGKGYTFWIDEVKFERLYDIANITGLISNGQERVIGNAETGDQIALDGFQASATMPTGINQLVNISVNYFTFSSSKPGIASVDAKGLISILDSGTAIITAKIGEKTALGSVKITSTGSPVAPTVAAPVPPAREAGDVISLYSNAYSNVNIDSWNPRWLYSTTDNFFIKVQNDDVVRYRSLNFVGVVFESSPINASAMSYFHMDIWTPDPTNSPNNFKILLVDFGANGAPGGGDDSQHEITISSPTLESNKWVSLDIPLSAFAGLKSRTKLAQLVLSGTLPNLYVDNVYFYRNPVVPTTAAPVPTKAADDVLSLFSDSYTNVAGTDFNPNWGQSTVVTQTPIAGNNTLRYSNFNYQGVQIGASQNLSTYGFLHLDYYSSNASALNVFLISPGAETPYTLDVPTTGWNSVDIPLSTFSSVVNLSDVIQLKFDGGTGGDIFLDNIYFWRYPIVPVVGAPVPTHPASNVLSIFSDSYTNVSGTDFNPNWGQSTVVTQPSIAGNNTLRYATFNYQGIQIGTNQDVSSYGFLHVDFYSGNASTLRVFLISPGAETPYTLNVPTAGWSSVNIPLSAFAGVNLSNVFQFKFDGGTGKSDIFLDNIYFHKSSGGGAFTLDKTIDFESNGFGANWTWNVFENAGNPPLEFVSNPNSSGINTSSTVAKFTANQTGQPYAGTEVKNGFMGTFNLDADHKIVKIMVYKTTTSDVGIKFAKIDGWSKGEIKVPNTAVNTWQELTFDFTSQIESGYTQIIIFPDFNARTSTNVIYFDNIRFGK